MTLPLRRGVPRLRSVGADGLAILVSLIALSTGSASVGAEDLPDKVVLDFTATWCGPCQKMSPIVHQLEQQGYIIRKVDVDRQRKLAQSYGIRSIPTFVLVIDGREVDRITGMASEEQLRRLAERTIERPAPPARELPRDDLPFPGNARTASATQDVELPFAVSPDEAPDFSAPSTAAPSQPSGLFPKPKFPSLFPKRKVASVAERDSRPLPTDVRSQTPDAGGDLSTEDRLLAVTARLIVSDATGSNFGSGTIIDSRPGQSVILTCGHIFRSAVQRAKEKSEPTRVQVDVFSASGRPETHIGRLVDADLEGDVGVVTISTKTVLPMTPVAALTAVPLVKDRLVSVGCGGGDPPSAETVQVTALNRYDGPDNIECTGVPVQGRSGGGLFDARGNLVGVCIAADQEGRRGLYAGLKPIHTLLTRAGLHETLPSDALDSAAPMALAGVEGDKSPSLTTPADSVLNRAFGEADAAAFSDDAPPSPEEIARLFDAEPDAEVICIVRSRHGGAGRVVILNEPSTRFVSYLLDSLDAPRAATPQAASLRVEDSTDRLGGDWVADDEIGIPKRAPALTADDRGQLARTEAPRPPLRRSRFGSRSEN